jgi:phosphatidylglycerophosphate synthase
MSDTVFGTGDWRTKPTDRFILKWIKTRLAAPLTLRLVSFKALQPWMLTVASMIVGIASAALFAASVPFLAGVLLVASQVLDGADGQLSRIRNTQSPSGAFLDSVLDRYTDGAVCLGLLFHTLRSCPDATIAWPLIAGFLALAGSGLISYTTARAATLDLDMGRPTLVSKGTRMAAVAIAGLLSPLLPWTPYAALIYLAAHTNLVVIARLRRAFRGAD